MNENISTLYEALRRTDSYTAAADQKASFTLAAGITFMGIYSSIFYNMITSDDVQAPTTVLVSIIGIVLIVWAIWFYKIRKVFSPNVTPSSQKSIISFASIVANHKSFNEYVDCYRNINTKATNSNLSNLELDILENHWICADICMQKMNSFKESLTFLWISLVCSLFGISVVAFYSEVLS